MALFPGGPAATARIGSSLNALVAESGSSSRSNVAYGLLPRHRLDIYEPDGSDGTGPLAIFFYGGGWTQGERAYYAFVGSALAARGITAVIPDYRLFPEVRFPSFVEDAALAYAWVTRNLANKRAMPRPITVIGHSAGAHIAALLAYDRAYLDRHGADILRPAGLAGLAGPYAFDPTTWPSTKDVFAGVANPDDARPAAFARNGGPPALLMHGASDTIVKTWNMETMVEVLQQAKTPVEAVTLDGIGHIGIVSAIAWPLRWRAPVLDRVSAFVIERHEAARVGSGAQAK